MLTRYILYRIHHVFTRETQNRRIYQGSREDLKVFESKIDSKHLLSIDFALRFVLLFVKVFLSSLYESRYKINERERF
jgi:hypothetical protein